MIDKAMREEKGMKQKEFDGRFYKNTPEKKITSDEPTPAEIKKEKARIKREKRV